MKSKPTTVDMIRLSVSLLVVVMSLSLVLLCTSSTTATAHSLSDPISNQVGQYSVIPSAAAASLHAMENSDTRSGSRSRVVRTIDIIKNALQHGLNFNSNKPSARKYIIAPNHRYGVQYNYYDTDRQDSGSKQRGHGNRQKGIYFRG